MRSLLFVTAALEGPTGIALLAWPSLPMTVLLGAGPVEPAAATIARVAGAALLSLGVACLIAGGEPRSRAAKGLIWALLTYNIATSAVLAHGAIAYETTGPGLWPVVAAHAALAIWCVAGLASPAARNGVGSPAP